MSLIIMNFKEIFITKKPNNSFIERYISYYYFHSSLNALVNKKFIYYPSVKNAITIYKNSRATYGHNYSSVVPDSTINFTCMYSGIQTSNRTTYISSPFNKIGIVFNELGINHFIKNQLSSVCSDGNDKSFNHFVIQHGDYFNSIYSKKEIDVKVSLLNEFFINIFVGFNNTELKQSINLINSSEQKITVEDLSRNLNISRRTLLRLFKKHLCSSVKDYINIVQFRKALNQYLLSKQNSSLTTVAHDNNFYDQPQFINHFKKLTNSSPKTFFKNVEHVGEEDTFWTFD